MPKRHGRPAATSAERLRLQERERVLASARHFRSTPSYGECLAIERSALDSLFFFGGPKPNERTPEGVVIVYIQGPLEHHSTWCWDNYEDILCRVEDAMTGNDLVRAHEQRARWRNWDNYGELPEGYEPLDATPARAVILCIDSPGGEASGTMYVHRKLRSLRKKYNVPLYAYANEMACSAAYAIASGADEIWLPDTGTVGSIGVIATLFDRTQQNEKVGLNIELITSGAYKADNHADRVLDDSIRARMQARVDSMANIFFSVVARARATSPKAIASLEAGVFIGQDAVDVGIADGVLRKDRFIELVAQTIQDSDTDTQSAMPAA